MIDNLFRTWLGTHSKFIVLLYQKIGLTPNVITLGSLLIAAIASVVCALGFDLYAIILWWLSRFFDGTDGILARHNKATSAFGAYLDIVCDMASYSLMVIGLSFRFPVQSALWLVTLGLYVLCITSALALGSLQAELKIPPSDNRGLRLGAGLIEGGETGIAYTIFLLLPQGINVWIYIWIALLATTVGFRCLMAYKILQVRS